MARDSLLYVCQSCGAVQTKWAGQCSGCGEWNSLVEEVQVGSARRDEARLDGARTRPAVRDPAIRHARAAAHRHRRDRVRPRLRRRRGARLGHPAGRRPRRRQVDPAAGGRGQGGAQRRARAPTSRAKRPSSRSAPAPSAWAWPTPPCPWPRPRRCATSSTTLKRDKFDIVIIDSIQTLWTDAHEAGPGSVTQVRACAGELVRLAKKQRPGHRPGRPRHQGRPDRRAARGRAHGRRGPHLRGRARLSVPHPARGQEPFRRHRRDRRLRDGRRRPARSEQPVGPVPGRRQGARAGRRRLRRHRGVAPGAGGDSGAGGARRPTARRGAPSSAGTTAAWP